MSAIKQTVSGDTDGVDSRIKTVINGVPKSIQLTYFGYTASIRDPLPGTLGIHTIDFCNTTYNNRDLDCFYDKNHRSSARL